MSGMPAVRNRPDGRTVGHGILRSDERPRLEPSNRPTDHPTDRPTDPVIVAESPSMRRAAELAQRFAPTGLPVLLVGETGTGKEVLAQAIHCWSGRRGALVDVDCGALPPGMVVSELFGHRRGAYTNAVESVPGLLEVADGGTLFLDELGSLPAEGQTSLLRVLATGAVRRIGEEVKRRVDLRLVAAVQDDVLCLGSQRRLRRDLYYRLAGTVIRLPPLRVRPEDLMPLARHFAEGWGTALDDSAAVVLSMHRWPGNARELRHVIARAVALADGPSLQPRDIAEAIEMVQEQEEGGQGVLARAEGWQRERERLSRLIREHGTRPQALAEALGVSRATLYRRLHVLQLRLEDFRGVPADEGVSPVGETSHETA